MEAIPEVIAIPYGNIKPPAVQAALRGGLVNSLGTRASLVTARLRGQHGEQTHSKPDNDASRPIS
jgi:DNA-binding transcriptional regulator LsrR (DeoR family)